MSIGFGKQSASSVPVPPVGEQNFFVDSSDDKFKKKLPDSSIVDLEGIASGVTSFNGRTGAIVPLVNDYLPLFPEATVSDDGLMSSNDKQKLDGIATGATANQTDAYLLNRSNHIGAQPASSISDFTLASRTASVINTLSGTETDQAPSVSATKAGDSATLVLANAYTDAAISGVIDGAPAALDTLNELAAALADDANFSSTVTTALSNRLRVDTAAQGLNGTQKTNAKTNIDLQNVDNTSDLDKPISNATQSALDDKITQLSGEASTPSAGSGVVTLSNAAIIAKLLTGLSEIYGQVLATDSLLNGFSKLAYSGGMQPRVINQNALIPDDWNWLRGNTEIGSGVTVEIGVNSELQII